MAARLAAPSHGFLSLSSAGVANEAVIYGGAAGRRVEEEDSHLSPLTPQAR